MHYRDQSCLRALLRLGAVTLLAASASACSTMNSLNPWQSSADVPPTQSDTAAPADTGQYPSVASVPDKPTPSSTPEERNEISSGLVADRTQAQYSVDALRGGTEPAAPPPPPAPPKDANPVQSPPPAPTDSNDGQSGEQDSDADAPSPVAPEPASGQAPATPPEQVATAESPPDATQTTTPVAPAPSVPPAQAATTPDAALGFKPSNAPPLDSSVSKVVAPQVIARYEASQSSAATIATPPATATPSDGALMRTATASATPRSALYQTTRKPMAVILFPNGGHALNEAANLQITAAVNSFKTASGTPMVRVVGHSSSRTPDMPPADHIAYVFKQSQDRANVVAQALVRAGIPAKSLVIEAVGDTQPIYSESMPKGEEGNRRVEIFIEG